MSLEERAEYYRKMNDSYIRLTHDDLPGYLYFSGFRSVSHFLKQHENCLNEIVIYIFVGDDPILLTTEECVLEWVPYRGVV